MVHPEIRQEIPDSQVGQAIVAAHDEQNRRGDEKTKVREQDQIFILLLEQWAAWQEVVDTAISVLLANALTFGLLSMVIMTSHIGEQIGWPAAELLGDHYANGVNRRLLQQFVHLVDREASGLSMFLPSSRCEDHVSLHVASRLVMLAVANLPAEIGNEKSGMQNPSYGVVQDFAGRERLVTALMSQHPQAGGE